MDPDAALDLATDPYADPTDRAVACAQLVAWVRSGGFLPDLSRYGYEVERFTGNPPGWLLADRNDDIPNPYLMIGDDGCVTDRRYKAVNEAVHRIWMDRDARKEWLAVNGV